VELIAAEHPEERSIERNVVEQPEDEGDEGEQVELFFTTIKQKAQ
jgi:hypothetical protein